MSDTAIAEVPAGPVPAAPEAVAELEAASSEAEVPSEPSGSTEIEAASVEADEATGERAVPEYEYELGPVRQGVIDHLIDTAPEPQSVAQIIAGLGIYGRGAIETAALRNFRVGLIERVVSVGIAEAGRAIQAGATGRSGPRRSRGRRVVHVA
jgi:hypothetical protein